MAHILQSKKPPLKDLTHSNIETFHCSRKVALPKVLLDDIIRPSWNKRVNDARGKQNDSGLKVENCLKNDKECQNNNEYQDDSGVNDFIIQNIGIFGWNGQMKDFSRLILTKGNLPAPTSYGAERVIESEDEVLIMWTDEEMDEDDERMDDQLGFVVFCKDLLIYSPGCEGGPIRKHGAVSIGIPFPEEELHVFAFFTNKDHTDYSLAWYECL
ncbi:hypothetical protein EYV94_27535 [Puteibacter caeruleilacunae]|nr:hypothetical protein EYV94_27535 [Puteibacter caeruleilacunae]